MPQLPFPIRLNGTLLLFLGIAITLGFALQFSVLNTEPFTKEGGVLEDCQVLILILATLAWIRAFGTIAHWTLPTLFITAYATFALREVSWLRIYDLAPSITTLLERANQVIALVVLITLGVTWLSKAARQARIFRWFLTSHLGTGTILGFCLVLVGDVFEKKFLPISTNLFWEEWFEILGYGCMLFAVVHFTLTHKRAANSL